MRKALLPIMILLSTLTGYAAEVGNMLPDEEKKQETAVEEQKTEKEPEKEPEKKKESKWSGKPVVTLFANFHAGMAKYSPQTGFGLERAYIGYKANYNNEVFATVIVDAGISEFIENTDFRKYRPYLKNAFVQWKRNWFDISFGLVGTQSFSLQNKFFGCRYIMRPFTDVYGGLPTADLGIMANFRATDWLKFDVSIFNGEGYKKIAFDNSYRFAAGVTFEPVENFLLRLYYDYYMKPGMLSDKTEETLPDGMDGPIPDEHALAFFIGYRAKHFLLGAEFQYIAQQKFTNMSRTGFSVFGKADLCKHLNLFARYDMMFSDIDKGLWKNGDVMAVRGGLEYQPFKFLKISPNVSYENVERLAPGADHKKQLYFYLNVLFNL